MLTPAKDEASRYWLTCLALVTLCCVTLAPSWGALLPGLQDEGTVANNAANLLHGRFPYVDYFLRIPPLTDWMIGVFMGVFGQNLATLRGYFLLEMVVLTILLFALGERFLPRGLAWIPPVWVMLVGAQAWPMASFHWDAAIWALLACFLLAQEKDFLAGWAVAFCGMALHTVGAALWLAALIGVAWEKEQRWDRLAKLNAGIALPSILFLILLATQGALLEFFRQTLFFNAENYLQAQGHSLDFSPVWSDLNSLWTGIRSGQSLGWFPAAASYFVISDLVGFLLFYPLTLVAPFYLFKKECHPVMKVVALTLMLTALINLGRPNRYHLNFLLPFYSLVVVGAAARLIRGRRTTQAMVGVFTVFLVTLGVYNVNTWKSYRFPLSLSRGTVYTQSLAQAQILQDLQQMMGPEGGYAFAFPDSSLYTWLLGFDNPTRVTALLPMFYTPEQVRRAKADLERKETPWVLFVPLSDASIADYHFPLEEFRSEQQLFLELITEGYQERRNWGGLILYARP